LEREPELGRSAAVADLLHSRKNRNVLRVEDARDGNGLSKLGFERGVEMQHIDRYRIRKYSELMEFNGMQRLVPRFDFYNIEQNEWKTLTNEQNMAMSYFNNSGEESRFTYGNGLLESLHFTWYAKKIIEGELLNLAEKLQTTISVTNVSMQAGDHATQIYGNGNIGRVEGSNVFINQGPVAPSANDLLQRGVQLLRAGAYDESVGPLNQSLIASPSPDANYYLALATLRGQRPRALTYSLAKAIEGRLQVACKLDPHKAHYWYLLALVKYDFFIENGFLDDVDEINELLSTGNACPLIRAFIVELLNQVPATNCPVYEIIQDRI